MKVNVTFTATGQLNSIEMNPNDTVWDLANSAAEEYGVPAELAFLRLNNQLLEDNATLSSLANNGTLSVELLLDLDGGNNCIGCNMTSVYCTAAMRGCQGHCCYFECFCFNCYWC